MLRLDNWNYVKRYVKALLCVRDKEFCKVEIVLLTDSYLKIMSSLNREQNENCNWNQFP